MMFLFSAKTTRCLKQGHVLRKTNYHSYILSIRIIFITYVRARVRLGSVKSSVMTWKWAGVYNIIPLLPCCYPRFNYISHLYITLFLRLSDTWNSGGLRNSQTLTALYTRNEEEYIILQVIGLCIILLLCYFMMYRKSGQQN